ncbi:MAG: hypothetical protein WBN89_16675 [Prochlorococcaceae cyanobacterium]
MASPPWLRNLSAGFKAHRLGRPGWFLELNRDRLRVVSAELPPRPGEPPGGTPKRRAFSLGSPPGPGTAAAALSEACSVFDAVMAGTWRWPDPADAPAADDPGRLAPQQLERLIQRLQQRVVGEQVSLSTWERHYLPPLRRLMQVAAQQHWPSDLEVLEATLRQWQPNSRSRQLAHDRIRRLWAEAGWEWPEQVAALRGNGRAAAAPDGVRAFTDAELAELRARLQRSHRLTPADAVAWDCLMVFGLRPAELQGLQLELEQGQPVARVTRSKRSSKGSSGPRVVPAVPPAGWPADCWRLVERWLEHGLPAGMVAARSPGEVLGQQLGRLQRQKPAQINLPAELTPYSCRHAFALRLAQQVGLHVREAAELMGHSPAVHLSTYGRRLDLPNLREKVRRAASKAASSI